MIKFYISYYYKLRFMPEDALVIGTSTTWPFWDKKTKTRYRLEPLVPQQTCCPCDNRVSSGCEFKRLYKQQLDALDFDNIIKPLEEFAESQHKTMIVLMVYEAPDNTCSERSIIVQWFKDHGKVLEEFS